MSQPRRDFWGDLDQPAENAENPVLVVLEEQANVLSTKTRGRLSAEVVPKTQGRLPIRWEFQLVAPYADFRYALFLVTQHGLDFPVEIRLYGPRNQTWHCADLDELEHALQQVLQSTETRKAIESVRAVDRLQGRRYVDVQFSTDGTGQRDVVVILEPLPRVADGTTYTALISEDGGLVLEATVEISGSAQAEQSEDELMKRVGAAFERILAAPGDGRGIGTHPVVRLHGQEKTFVRDHEGRLHPL